MAEAFARPSDRQEIEQRLDALVERNRFTIAVVFPLVGAVLLLASAEGLLPAILAFNPYLVLSGVLVMRLPLVAGLLPLVGKRALTALSVLTLYSYAIEYVGATTGFPYGDFVYEVPLGPMLADTIPVGLPVFFLPLVLNSYLLCLLLLGERAKSAFVRLPAVIAAVLAVDMVLDPAAVALGFWSYGGGVYYGVPLSNYAGWVLSATVATLLVDFAFDSTDLVNRVRSCPFMLDDLVSFVLLWGAVNAVYGAWIPVGVALLFGVGLVQLDRFDFAVWNGLPGRTRK
ncbi:bisanhydrobacterioruberin hydratase [Salinibaculum rarum]|uniref:bisanhydrobacterioruberin hydratase n=1 Tax=Salinibaculum rarum TaxID=3058903 RepID=UPI00265F2203|nr:bisanhydrobacterioruberin hydratase [Salinibaculum sp. KK48]